jgi:hypothetical protein
MMTSWHSYPSIFALGHRAIANLLDGPVLVEEKVDGCVALDTPILMADLSYRPAGDIRVADSLVGITDRVKMPRLCRCVATIATPIVKPCYELTTETRRVVASADHPWLVAKPMNHSSTTNSRKRWVGTEALKSGDMIMALPTWSWDRSWEAGYLAGFFNGEGSLVRYENQRVLSAYQVVGPVFNDLCEKLRALGFTFSIDIRQRNADYQRAASVVIRGGWPEILRFLGTVRPQRLLDKAHAVWDEAPMNYIPRERVIAVCALGEREVMGLSTTSATYVANGLLCHNSQFSFGHSEDGELLVRSKGAVMHPDAPEKMFTRAVDSVKERLPLLHPGWTYRAEYLMKPKHNALAYDRVPNGHLIVFDVNTDYEAYLSYPEKRAEAERIGLECVPLLHEGMVSDIQMFRSFLETRSALGGQLIEGVVVKPLNYDQYGPDKKCLMGKFVSEAYKEVHSAEWKKENPAGKDILLMLGEQYRTPARWAKAVQHLRDRGELEGSPKDIGRLMPEVMADVAKEEREAIRETLWRWAWPHVRRTLTRGLPEWYKASLLERQFGNEHHAQFGKED